MDEFSDRKQVSLGKKGNISSTDGTTSADWNFEVFQGKNS